MDILDRHDLEAILRDPDLRGFKSSYVPMMERLERFFRVEIPERERLRRASTQPVGARTFTAIVRVLSPNNTDTNEAIVDTINARMDAYPIRVSTTARDGILDALTGLQNAGLPVEDGVPASETITKEVSLAARRRAASKKAGKASAKRRAWPLVAALTAVFLTACGGPMDDVADDALDADGGAELDGDVDPGDGGVNPDAMMGGLPLGSACDVLAAECAGGLTCRINALDPVGGECRAVGAALENDPCDLDNGDDDCGPTMACLGSADTFCYVICDPADPAPRCGVADTCVQAFGPDVEIGACSP